MTLQWYILIHGIIHLSKHIETYSTKNESQCTVFNNNLGGQWSQEGMQGFFLKFVFIDLFLAVLVLHCYADFSLVVVSGGYSLVVVCVRLIAAASLVANHGLQACRLQQLQHMGSVVMAPRLQSIVSVVVGAWAQLLCRILLDQGLNLCLLHWQEDSSPLSHQGSLRNADCDKRV